MAYSDYFSQYYRTLMLQDCAQLGRRMFIGDGTNPNMVSDGFSTHDRIMGCWPQQGTLTLALSATGTPAALETGETYTYGVRRVARVGTMEIPSAMTLGTLENASGATRDGKVTLVEYEYAPDAGSEVEVLYEVWRSKKDALTLLYRVAQLTEAQFDLLTTGIYVDVTPDASLNLANSYNTETADPNQFVPPCRYVRAWKGRLVLAGSCKYDLGTATVTAGTLDEVVIGDGGNVRAVDVGAYLHLHGERITRYITAADEASLTLTLDDDVSEAKDAVAFSLFRDYETIYVTNPLAENIEGYTVGYTVYSNQGTDDPIMGLGVSGSYCYVFRRYSVEALEGVDTAGTTQLTGIAGGAGCVSHATIADQSQGCPGVIRYCGENGVWFISGTEDVKISRDIDYILQNDVDHQYDNWTHGVWDAENQLYHLWVFRRGDVEDNGGLQVPQLLLTWDATLKFWYVSEMAVSRAAIAYDEEGKRHVVIGVAGGYAYMNLGDYDGVDVSGTLVAADSSTASTLTDASGGFSTDYTGLAGFPIHVTHSDGTWERRIVKSNTADTITIYGEWDTNPATGDTYHVGAIRWNATTREIDGLGTFENEKVYKDLIVVHDKAASATTVTILNTAPADAATRTQENDFDFSLGMGTRLQAAQAGLRGRWLHMKLSGDGTVPIVIHAIQATTENARG